MHRFSCGAHVPGMATSRRSGYHRQALGTRREPARLPAHQELSAVPASSTLHAESAPPMWWFECSRLGSYFACPPRPHPARIVHVPSLLLAEHAENEIRKEFDPIERAAIGEAIEAELKAQERRGRPKADTGQGDLIEPEIVENFRQYEGQKSEQVAAKQAGFGNETTYRQAKAVKNNAEPELQDAVRAGDVSSAKLVKTKMAKSVLDAGWAQLKTQLKYKAIGQSAVFIEVNEAYSTQTCSCCGSIPDSSPKGRAGLEVRHWVCSCCGATHDRDVNAAINILNAGLGCQSQ